MQLWLLVCTNVKIHMTCFIFIFKTPSHTTPLHLYLFQYIVVSLGTPIGRPEYLLIGLGTYDVVITLPGLLWQVELACKVGKPLFIHDREAHSHITECLDLFRDRLPPVVIHCFTGTTAEAQRCVSMGMCPWSVGVSMGMCPQSVGVSPQSPCFPTPLVHNNQTTAP